MVILFSPLFGESYTHINNAEASEKTPKELVIYYANKYQVSRETIMKIITCESNFNPQAKNITSKESSYGLAQINLKVHNITIEQATNPEFAIRFLAKNLSENRSNMWFYCYRAATKY